MTTVDNTPATRALTCGRACGRPNWRRPSCALGHAHTASTGCERKVPALWIAPLVEYLGRGMPPMSSAPQADGRLTQWSDAHQQV